MILQRTNIALFKLLISNVSNDKKFFQNGKKFWTILGKLNETVRLNPKHPQWDGMLASYPSC